MRVSENMRYDAVSRNLGDLASRQADAAQKASSGQRVSAPSDDPAAAAELTRLSAAKAKNQAYQSAVSSVRSDAELAEGALGEAGDTLARVRELAMQGANDSLAASDRASLADEVASLKQHLVSLANTQGANGYLFGGTQTNAAPFSSSGGFNGNDADHEVEISAGVVVRANASGAQAFTAAGGTDVFATMDALEAALRSNSQSSVSGTLAAIDASRSQVTQARAASGLMLDRLTATDSALSKADETLASSTKAVGDADPYSTYSDLTKLSSALEQAIAVARVTLTPGGQRF
jgi:flagellar hook-associated protein 3 FlgL